MQLALLCVAGGILFVSAGLFATLLRFASPVAYGLATNLIAWTMVVGATLGLSPLQAVRPATTWIWLLAASAAALASWGMAGRPRPPLAGIRGQANAALAGRMVRVLALVVAAGVGYSIALAAATPENEGDSLVYHVARAAFWYQDRAVGYIGNAIETRLNVNPPNAEIGQLFTMLASGSQRFVGLVQIAALLVCVLATVGLARRLGGEPRAALWAGLLVATLPVIATQAPTALNDLVVASFLATAAFFLLGSARSEHILAGLALALGVGTKFTAVLSIPVLLLVIASAPGPRRLAKAFWLLAVGALGGSVWYLVNLAETGHLDGGLADQASQTPGSLHVVAGTLVRFVFGSLDLSVGSSRSELLYLDVGFTMLLVAVVAQQRRRTGSFTWLGLSAVCVAAAPIVVRGVYEVFERVAAGHVAGLASGPNLTAGATPSWFGPLGSIGLLAGVLVAVRAFRRGTVDRSVLVLSAAPLLLMACLAVALVWDPWRGRFFIFGFVLAVAAWHLLYPSRWLSWAVTVVACITMTAALVNTLAKPSGLSILGGSAVGVWGKPDWFVQSILRPGGEEVSILRFSETRIPAQTTLAVAPRGNDFLSPYFGRDLTRRLSLVLDGGRVSDSADWLIAAPGVRPVVCRGEWRVLLAPATGWLILERARAHRPCAAPARLNG